VFVFIRVWCTAQVDLALFLPPSYLNRRCGACIEQPLNPFEKPKRKSIENEAYFDLFDAPQTVSITVEAKRIMESEKYWSVLFV